MSIEQQQNVSLICVQVALMYMMRRNCHMLAQRPRNTSSDKRWLSHIRFITAIFNNLRKAGIDENGKLFQRIACRGRF